MSSSKCPSEKELINGKHFTLGYTSQMKEKWFAQFVLHRKKESI